MVIEGCDLSLGRDRRELQSHGTPDFPCAGYASVYRDCAEEEIPWHWHEEMEVIVIAEGKLLLQVPGKTFHMEKGDGMFINSNILHRAQAEPECEIHSLVFHAVLIMGSEHSAIARRYLYPLTHCQTLDACLLHPDEDEGRGCSCIASAFQAVEKGGLGYEFTVREQLSCLCLMLYQSYRPKMGETYEDFSPDTDRIRKMLDFIQEHYSESLELSSVAKSADIGERECLRCFKRMIQISPMQYVIQYRVTQAAAMLLSQSGASISEISTRCGFESPSNFSQAFKRIYQCTPKEYRRIWDTMSFMGRQNCGYH